MMSVLTEISNALEMGKKKLEEIKAKAALAEQKKGTGTTETEILYEEADGVWLKLQGKDRQENGTDKVRL